MAAVEILVSARRHTFVLTPDPPLATPERTLGAATRLWARPTTSLRQESADCRPALQTRHDLARKPVSNRRSRLDMFRAGKAGSKPALQVFGATRGCLSYSAYPAGLGKDPSGTPGSSQALGKLWAGSGQGRGSRWLRFGQTLGKRSKGLGHVVGRSWTGCRQALDGVWAEAEIDLGKVLVDFGQAWAWNRARRGQKLPVAAGWLTRTCPGPIEKRGGRSENLRRPVLAVIDLRPKDGVVAGELEL
jgi:hypothetical protein